MKNLLNLLLSFRKNRKFMVLGTKDFPVNPNDVIPTWTERDNPCLFSSREEAERFVAEIEKQNIIYDEDWLCYLRIVELV